MMRSNSIKKTLGYCYSLVGTLFLSLFCATQAIAQTIPIQFKHVSATDGLSQGNGICVYQDRQGFMWLGTNDGLNKYDGYKMVVYRKNPADSLSIVTNGITSLYEDSEGNLWIGTYRGLSLYNRKHNNFTNFKSSDRQNSLSSNYIQAISGDPSGHVWIGTSGGANRFNPKDSTFTRFLHDDLNPNSLVNNVVNLIYPDQKGRCWFGTQQGLSRWDEGSKKFINYQHKPGDSTSISSFPIHAIAEDRVGHLWVATRGGGISVFNPATQTFRHYNHSLTDPNSLPTDIIYSLLTDRNGNMWVGTENEGLSLFHPSTNHFDRYLHETQNPHSLSNNTVASLYEDSMGNIWAGALNGGGFNYFTLAGSRFKHFKAEASPSSLTSNNIRSLWEDSKGNILIGTDGGGLNVFNRKTGSFVNYRFNRNNPKGLSSDVILDVREDHQGRIWMGTWLAGLNCFEPEKGTFTHYVNDPLDSTSIGSNTIFKIFEDSQHRIWVGTQAGLNRFDEKKKQFARLNYDPKKPSSIVLYSSVIVEDKQGFIWLNSPKGLERLDPRTDQFTHYSYDEKNQRGLPHEDARSLLIDHAGRLWVGTPEGLSLLNASQGTFTTYTEKDGLSNKKVQGLLEDSQHTLWISTVNGLNHFNPATGKFQVYNIVDGLQGNEFSGNTALKTRTGEMYFGGNNGFNRFHPDSIRTNTFQPPVHLTDFQIFNQSIKNGEKDSPLPYHINHTKTITLSYKQSVFSFEFVALNYGWAEKNQYAYMLEGFEKNWNYVGTQHKATYTNLDPGEYVFRVKASNEDGVWNEKGASIKVIILPPFWQTWWFRTAIILGIMGSAITFYKVRMNAIKAQKVELENQVKARTSEVMLQKEELQTQAENLQNAIEELQEQQEEILQQQEEMKSQAEVMQEMNQNLHLVNDQVMSSIQYANTIQKALLPSEKKLNDTLADHFVLYRPKDVVSGDFYWFSSLPKEDLEGQEDDLTFIAAIDCTGHGVPGAFMSIIGHTLLNEIINFKHVLDPAQVLELLDTGVRKAIEKAEGVNTAGMDVCLLRLQKGEGGQTKVLYAGAKRPLYYVRKGNQEVEVLEADRRSIGSQSKVVEVFTTQAMTVEAGTRFYLTTDGYVDQNNVSRIKLGTARFKQAISQLTELPLTNQKEAFEKLLDEHQQNAEQRDDITLVGVMV